MLPTKIYVKSVLSLLKANLAVKAMAHITGGGITENVPRALPENVNAQIDLRSWQPAPIFGWIQTQGNVEQTEMLRTFNCGIGFTLVVDEKSVSDVLDSLHASGESACVIGKIEKGDGPATVIYS